jgi:tripartite-type tricarboxylate transporter receptor subunit TctC
MTPLSASYPGLVISTWFGLFPPSGRLPAVTAMLENELKKIFGDPELQRRVSPLGLEPEWMSSADFSQRIASDTAKWRDLIEEANIKPN